MRTILDGRGEAERAVLALGMFDGVHIGHRILLKRAKALARQRNVPLVACTFLSHPMTLIAPEKCPPMLSTFEERARLMELLGVDMLFAMPFDRTVMNMLPEVYIGELVRRFHPTDLVCGYNHSFGKKGLGSPTLLAALGNALGFQVSVVPKITFNGGEISSSAIRGLLGAGEAARARELLGRPYERSASLVERRRNRCELVMAPDGKQDIPAGWYRILWDDGQHAYPATLEIKRTGRGSCYLPKERSVSEQAILRFVARAPIAVP